MDRIVAMEILFFTLSSSELIPRYPILVIGGKQQTDQHHILPGYLFCQIYRQCLLKMKIFPESINDIIRDKCEVLFTYRMFAIH